MNAMYLIKETVALYLIYLMVNLPLAASQCSTTAIFHRVGEKRLTNSVISQISANNEVECALLCSRNGKCKSVNYITKETQERSRSCELNGRKISEAEDFVEDDASTEYLEIIRKHGSQQQHQPTIAQQQPSTARQHPTTAQKQPTQKQQPKNNKRQPTTAQPQSTTAQQKPTTAQPQQMKKMPKSCKEILTMTSEAKSGLYNISVDNVTVTVYCEMILDGGGFTFVPKSAVKKGTLPSLLSQLFTERDKILLFIQRKNGNVSYTLIEQLQASNNHPLVLLQHTTTVSYMTYNLPKNAQAMVDYLYLGTSLDVKGFQSNGQELQYGNGPGEFAYFAFFPNHEGKTPSSYIDESIEINAIGVDEQWRNTGEVINEKIPENYFFLTEMHYEESCYTTSDRWLEANGTAIGMR